MIDVNYVILTKKNSGKTRAIIELILSLEKYVLIIPFQCPISYSLQGDTASRASSSAHNMAVSAQDMPTLALD